MSSGAMRRVLLLGSGLTSGPLVECLTREGNVAITVASNILPQADLLASTYQNTIARSLDIHSEDKLSTLVKDHELVISFVPFALHPIIAKHCLTHKKNMITASYVLPAMQALHQPAIEQGITILNEVGFDPGIDHMLAMKCFDEVRDKGGKILSFESWCGGLPHPQYSDNPLKYKFSWSPISVFMASKNQAKFIRDGKTIEIKEGKIFDPENVATFNSEDGPISEVEFEGYYNRDSTRYVGIYNIPEAKTVIRSTYRYKGYCKITRVLFKLGLFDTAEHKRLQPGSPPLKWKDLMATMVAESENYTSIYQATGGDDEIMQALEKLRLLSDDLVEFKGSPMSTLCAFMEQMLRYNEGEMDAVFLQDFIKIQWPDNKVEKHRVGLNLFGSVGVPGRFTAMAQVVGKPAAIAAKLILDGKLNRKGVLVPTTRDIYGPILDSLKAEGIVANT